MPQYSVKNIRALLTEGFSDQELRRFLFGSLDFRPVYNELAHLTGKAEIIDRIIEYTEQKLLFEPLLEWAKVSNPARFKAHGPYDDNEATTAPVRRDTVQAKSALGEKS